MTLILKNFFGKGGSNLVYVNPIDSNKCIKVLQNKKRKKIYRFKKEIKFYKKNKNKFNLYKHFPICYNLIKTDKGIGICYELIKNDTGDISINIENFIKLYGKTDELIYHYKVFINWLIKNKIYIGDGNMRNILVQIKNNRIERLVLIEGFNNHQYIFINKYFQSVKSYLKRKNLYNL